eukprot:TRINITY_DN12006_c0_g2_i1.p2 TRINITY_DN12006_c0_g2~~TRINITY_DN12006_c0_g2_i1.p2  ORF type:complete len:179 (+),score=4.54 TRINITY_DN12006_c0_g2_i1:372-908(+)
MCILQSNTQGGRVCVDTGVCGRCRRGQTVRAIVKRGYVGPLRGSVCNARACGRQAVRQDSRGWWVAGLLVASRQADSANASVYSAPVLFACFEHCACRAQACLLTMQYIPSIVGFLTVDGFRTGGSLWNAARVLLFSSFYLRLLKLRLLLGAMVLQLFVSGTAVISQDCLCMYITMAF